MDAPSALDESADRPAQADQPGHGRCGMVNSPLRNPARLSVRTGFCEGPDTQCGLSAWYLLRIKQR
jgi:hypothetical protein